MADETLRLGGDPNCDLCEGTGINQPVLVLEERSEPCPLCQPTEWLPARYSDEDADGWLDGIEVVRAKYCDAAGTLPTERVEEIVIHRLARGKHAAGPRYVSTLCDGREVGWHWTLHAPGWKRLVTQHVPITRVAWHCGSHNKRSIGIEIDGPMDSPFAPETLAELARLVKALVLHHLPYVKRIVSHRYLCPKTRRDPGPDFPWEIFDGLGLEIRK